MPPNEANEGAKDAATNTNTSASDDAGTKGAATDGNKADVIQAADNAGGDAAKTAAAATTTASAGSDAVAKPATAAATAAPEKYELTLPQGTPMEATEAQAFLDKAAADAKARGLSQEQANALLGDRAEVVKQHREIVSNWEAEIKADKDFGGENLPKTLEQSAAVLTKFFPGIDKAALNKTGFGSHPEFLRGLARIGRAMQPDGFIPADGPGQKEKTTAELLYPNMAAKKS